MTPRQIEVFRAVMMTGSVTAASEQLNVSQPSVSKQIQLLEHAIGFQLFERSGNRLKPTVEAMLVFEKVQTVYAGLEQVNKLAASIRENRSGEVIVGSMPLLAHFWLPQVVAGLMIRAEEAVLSLPVRSTDWILRAVAAGRIDIGLGLAHGNASGVEALTLMKLPLVCLARAGHRFETQKTVTSDQLEAENVVLLRSFEAIGADTLQIPEVTRRAPAPLEVFTTAAAGEIVLAGFGVTVVDAFTAHAFEARGLVARPVETTAHFEIVLYTPRTRSQSRMASFVRNEILKLAGAAETELEARYGVK